MKDMLFYERQAAEGGLRIAGMDEAGRGPLAGPVVVAAVVMPLSSDKLIADVDDSKKLSEKKREALYEQIMQVAEEVQVALPPTRRWTVSTCSTLQKRPCCNA